MTSLECEATILKKIPKYNGNLIVMYIKARTFFKIIDIYNEGVIRSSETSNEGRYYSKAQL